MNSDVQNRIFVDALQYSNWDRELFEELRAGGLTAVHVTIAYWENTREAISAIAKWNRFFRLHADIIMPCRDGADIVKAQSHGKTAVILGFQNVSPIENELALVQIFYELGVRIMQLTYNNQTLVGGGCFEQEDSGVTRFGRHVIKEMNRVGMVVDLSHSGERTTLDAIDISERPVAITHGNPRAFHAVARNKSEKVIRALGESGGMLGFSLYPLHISGGADCTLDAFCKMIVDTIDVVGVDHVGIGTDMCRKFPYETLQWMRNGTWSFDMDYGEDTTGRKAWPDWPSWFQSPADFPRLEKGLLQFGLSSDEIVKIMGGNWLRYFDEGFRPLR